jgi:hypothetical protein
MVNVSNLPNKAAVSKSRNLFGACLTHVLRDGYTDQLYALLPAWQTQFGLSYMGLAMVRALYTARWADFRFQPIASPAD